MSLDWTVMVLECVAQLLYAARSRGRNPYISGIETDPSHERNRGDSDDCSLDLVMFGRRSREEEWRVWLRLE